MTRTIHFGSKRFPLNRPIGQALQALRPILYCALEKDSVQVQTDPYDADTRVPVSNPHEAWKEISSVDESILFIDGDWFLIILENGPDCISDHKDTASASAIASMAG